MNAAQLQILYEHKQGNESLNETWTRLFQDGTLNPLAVTPEEALKPITAPEVQQASPIPESARPDADASVVSSGAISSYGEELTVPRYKVVQPSCQIEGATTGMFLNTLTQEEVEKLENVVLLTRQDTRSLFADGDFSGTKQCWSQNGYVPDTEKIKAKTSQEPVAAICARRDENGKLVFCCPLAEWRNQRDEIDPKGTKPPKCKASVKFLGLELQSQLPFTIIFHGSALPIIKNFLRIVNYKREGARQNGNDLQLYHFKINIGLKQQTTSKGRFFIPVFEQNGVIANSEERALLQKAHEYYKDWFSSELSMENKNNNE